VALETASFDDEGCPGVVHRRLGKESVFVP
jgi:hypothetical protein